MRATQLREILGRNGWPPPPRDGARNVADGLGEILAGVHGLESHDGRSFRWTEPVALLRLLLPAEGAVLRIDTGFIHHLGYRYRPHEETEALEIPRARGIRVAAQEKLEVEQLVAALGRIDAGPAILAIPDSPEVYFLSGLRNPSKTLFDFYEEPEARTGRVLALVDGEGLSAVVLNRRRLFAPLVEGPLLDSLESRLDWSAEIGRFRVLWAGPPDGGAERP